MQIQSREGLILKTEHLSIKIKIILFLFPNSFLILINFAASIASVELKIKLKEKPATIFLKKSINLIFEKLLTIINHLIVINKGSIKNNAYIIKTSLMFIFVKINKKFF